MMSDDESRRWETKDAVEAITELEKNEDARMTEADDRLKQKWRYVRCLIWWL